MIDQSQDGELPRPVGHRSKAGDTGRRYEYSIQLSASQPGTNRFWNKFAKLACFLLCCCFGSLFLLTHSKPAVFRCVLRRSTPSHITRAVSSDTTCSGTQASSEDRSGRNRALGPHPPHLMEHSPTRRLPNTHFVDRLFTLSLQLEVRGSRRKSLEHF